VVTAEVLEGPTACRQREADHPARCPVCGRRLVCLDILLPQGAPHRGIDLGKWWREQTRSVCQRGSGEESALTRVPRRRWLGQGLTEAQEPIDGAAPPGFSLVTRSMRRGLAAGMRSSKFQRPGVRHSGRGSSHKGLERPAGYSRVA
jgi:hypothetical protein